MPTGKSVRRMPQDWKYALQGTAIGCLLATVILWPTFISLTQVWRSNQAYQFAWLVIPAMIYLLGWQHRSATIRVRPRPDLSGVAIATVAAVCWIAADLMNIDAGRQLAFVLAIQGIFMAALGWRPYWELYPALWLLFLMIPSGDLFQPVLRHLTVMAIEFVAIAFHLPYRVNGFLITIGANDYIVLSECAGLPYFLLATFLGYVFGLMLYRPLYKILALTLFGAFIGILSNVLRVAGIVLIDWVQKSQMPLTAHGNVQWVALILCLGLLLFVLSKLDAEGAAEPERFTPVISDSHPRPWAPMLAGFAVMVISGGSTWLIAKTSSTPNDAPFLSVPRAIAGWQLTSQALAWSINPENAIRSLSLEYRRDGETMGVRIVEPMMAEAKLQEAEVAPGKLNLWHENSIENLLACAGSECVKFVHTKWENGQTEERRDVYSTYALGDFHTTSKFALRAAYGWSRLMGRPTRPRLIGFSFASSQPDPVVAGIAADVSLFFSTVETGR